MNEPVDERLRRHLSGLDDVSVADVDAVRSAVEGVVRRRRRAGRAGAGVVSVLLVIGVAVAVVSHRGAPETVTSPTTAAPDTATSSTTTAPTTTSSPSSTSASSPTTLAPSARWTPLPADPRGVVYRPTAVWTGSEAIVVGGTDIGGKVVGGAVAYTPSTNSWRRLAEPFGHAHAINPLAVWTGSSLLLIGGDNPDSSLLVSAGQAYDPRTNTWSHIAPPITGFITDRSPYAWTGKELLVWPGDGGGSTMDVTPIAYDPATNAWRSLASPPIARRQSAASVWTGTQWIVWGGTTGTAELSDGAAYDPTTDTWRMLARSPLTGRRVSAVWTGTEMLVDAGSSGGDPVTGDGELALADGAAYDPASNTWRTIAQGPAHPGFVPIWTGTYVVLFAKGRGVVYDPADDTWTGCCDERGPFGTPVWTGSVILVLGGGGDPGTGGAVFHTP